MSAADRMRRTIPPPLLAPCMLLTFIQSSPLIIVQPTPFKISPQTMIGFHSQTRSGRAKRAPLLVKYKILNTCLQQISCCEFIGVQLVGVGCLLKNAHCSEALFTSGQLMIRPTAIASIMGCILIFFGARMATSLRHSTTLDFPVCLESNLVLYAFQLHQYCFFSLQ